MWQTGCAAGCMACIQTLMLNHAPKTMCEKKGNAGVGICANLVSPRCVMVCLFVCFMVDINYAGSRTVFKALWF